MNVAREVVPQSVCSVFVNNRYRVYYVTERFGHLLSTNVDESVNKNLFRGGQTGRHKHRLPHRGLLPYLVLPRHLNTVRMLNCSPKLRKIRLVFRPAECRDVINQRVKPNEHHVVLVIGYGNAPWHFFLEARNAEIFQPCFHKLLYLVETKIRHDQVWLSFVQQEKLLLIP